MTDNQEDRRCGTCRWFGNEKPQWHKHCLCRYEKVPFWAKCEDDRYVDKHSGKNCGTWEAKNG